MKLQVLAGLISSAHGRTNSETGHRLIFDVATDFWRQDYVKDSIKINFPKSWEKWRNNKSSQLRNLGDKTQRAFDRCGQEST